MFKLTLITVLLFALLGSTLPLPAAPTATPYTSFAGLSKVSDTASLIWYANYAPTRVSFNLLAQPSTKYQCFGGGKTAKYPFISDWRSFDSLWAINLALLSQTNSPENNIILRKKILQVAAETSVDARIILAIIMQELRVRDTADTATIPAASPHLPQPVPPENPTTLLTGAQSTGTLNAPCTAVTPQGGNCGIMQAAHGSVSFDATSPSASIDVMIRNGVLGTPGSWPVGGPGIAWLLDGAPGGGAYYDGIGGGGHPYRALRAYNSGRVDPTDLDRTIGGFGVEWYVNDLANRLIGWNGAQRGCGYVTN